MKNLLFLTFVLSLFFSCQQTETAKSDNPVIPLTYPETRRDTGLAEDYHGTQIADPYRWLEIDTAADVEAWVGRQNKVTTDYLEQIPFREDIRKRYEELFNYPKLSSPFKVGEYYFFYKNDGLQNQSVIYVQKGLDGNPEVFIDPNALSKEGTVSINLIGFSSDDKYAAYSRQDAGSDWAQIKVMEVATKKELPDQLDWVKFSGAAWWKDGFFYSRYPEPAKGSELSGNNQYHSVYYHKLGDPQAKDKLVFENRQRPEMYHNAQVTEDEKYVIVYAAPGTDGFATHYKSLASDGKFVELFSGDKNKSTVIHNIGDKFLVLTDIEAPNYRLVEVDTKNPAKENWKEILPERENLLQGVNTGGGFIFANYLKNATDRFYRYNYDGSGEQEIALPGTGSAGGFGGKEKDELLFYTYTSFIYPPTIFKYDVKTGKSEEFYKTELKFNPQDYVERQVFYTSKDGTKVSMFIVHKKDLPMNGDNPA
ncbi:MAG TPA: S9 family peptidase, partial [Saprospiraceae bacterium]|nr:S9 family peptidase [Saprospiraceae bacterium]